MMLARFIGQLRKRGSRTQLRAGYSRLLAGDAAGALQIASDILAREPAFSAAHLLLAQAASETGDWERGLASIEIFLAAAGEHAEAYYIRGLIQQHRNRIESALSDYVHVLSIDPSHAPALDKKGALHDARGEFEASLACAEQLVRLDPADAQAQRKLGVTLRELGRFAAAAEALKTALTLDPGLHDARATLALVLIDLGDFDQADGILAQLLAAEPNHAQGHWARAVSNLLRGRFELAWNDYEWRESRLDAPHRLPGVPEWDGKPIDQGCLLLSVEQGLGDQIMFASCIADAQRFAPQCVIECDHKLETLFRRSFPAVSVFAGNPAVPAKWAREFARPIVAQLPLGSLPGRFRRNRSDFPAHSGYLVPDPTLVSRWQERLSSLGPGRKIGLSWTGGAPKTRRSLRSLALEQLLPVLLIPNCCFVSLQYGDSRTELEALQRSHQLTVHEVGAAGMDYDETAGLVRALDLVISVCTSVIHLAGSIGKPVWVLVPAAPEWRYMACGSEMPWYPSVRIWRQRRLGEWQEVVSAIAAELAGVCAE